MKTYYIDSEFRIHLEQGENRIPWKDEHGFFSGKGKTFVEGFRVIPEGATWKGYNGLMITAAVDFSTLDKAQTEQNGMRTAMDTAGAMLTDEQAVTVPDLYREWEYGLAYSVGDRRTYNGTLYKCLQEHEAQEAWNPADAPSLWAKVLIPDPDVIPEWEQPDSTNAYHLGDKVTYDGKTWVSDVDNNVWEPGEYGWTEI